MHTLTVWPVDVWFKATARPTAVACRGWTVVRLKWVDLLLPVATARPVEVRQGVRVRRGRVSRGPVGVADRLKWTDMLAGVE